MKYKKTNNCKKKKNKSYLQLLIFPKKIQLITNLTLGIERTFERKRFKFIWNKKNTDKIMRSALNE